jgi:hypothetical protein
MRFSGCSSRDRHVDTPTRGGKGAASQCPAGLRPDRPLKRRGKTLSGKTLAGDRLLDCKPSPQPAGPNRTDSRMHAAPALSEDRYAAFRHRAFALYFVARFLSAFGLQIISVSVGWQIYDLTRDPFDLGLVGLIQFLPALVLILFTGSAADRYGRRTIMMICEIVIGLCAVALVYFAWRGLLHRCRFSPCFWSSASRAHSLPRLRSPWRPIWCLPAIFRMRSPGIPPRGRPPPLSAPWQAACFTGWVR